MFNINDNTINDFLITFYIGKHTITKRLSEVIENKDNRLFLEEIGLPTDYTLPFFQEKGSNGLIYTLKQDGNDRYKITIMKEPCLNHVISDQDYISFKDTLGNNSFKALLIDTSKVKISYKKFQLSPNTNIFIGRNPGNQIVYNFKNLVSRDKHLGIKIDANGEAQLEDLKGTSYVYVNGKHEHSKKLQMFDEIEFLGLSMIYLGDCLAVRDYQMTSSLPEIRTYPSKETIKDTSDKKYFVRSPRILRSVDVEPIEVDAPPNAPHQDDTPLLLTLGPSLTMSLVMLASLSVSVFNALNGGNIATVVSSGIIAIGMFVGTLVWPLLLKNYNKRRLESEIEYRRQRYTHYISEIEKELKTVSDQISRLNNEVLDPSPRLLCTLLDNESNKLRLWERSYQDLDFLSVRLGLGQKPLGVDIKIPRTGFQLYDDELLELPQILSNKYDTIENVPITLDMFQNRTIGIIGDKQNMRMILDEILLNLISLHAYDEAKLVIVTSPKNSEQFERYKDIPHIWSNDKKTRYFATNQEEVHHIFTNIDEIVKEREPQDGEKANASPIPHYIFLVTEPSLIEREPLLRYLNNPHNRVGITTIFAYGDITQLPTSCETIVQSDRTRTGYYIKNQNGNRFTEFNIDTLSPTALDKFTHDLQKLEVKRDSRTLGIPDSVPFLQMYKAGNIKELGIEQRWESNNSSRSLAAPVGIMAGGELFNLDLHENYHGSHGLVAGTTGSGKSEFLQELILSLAVNYSPKEVAFVLVDFKGGDMARPFMEKRESPALPHLAATISNLSGNILYRALISLDAEIKYRQRLFNEASATLGVDKLDINSYHRYFKAGKLKTPLPHLVIIIDEFAQLKTQQQDFLTQLINVAQVGRSLGIHLILATQKPSGIVDPQIWSNSRFKICLKVADKQDSIEVIGKPDSAFIKNPGRFYVQVGYDEIYEFVQSGYSGANYLPTDHYIPDEEITVQMTDNTASPLHIAKLDVSNDNYNEDETQIEAIVSEIANLGVRKDTKAKPLWLDVLPEEIYLDEIYQGPGSKYSATIGLLDLIRTQEQKPLELDFTKNGHLAIYGASGTGKTTFLQTLVYSMVKRNGYTPEDINFYALDFGGRNLGYLETLPHTGNVIYSDEEEKIEEFIELLNTIVQERIELFSMNHTSTFNDYNLISDKKLPAIFVLIDNYTPLREKYINLSDEISDIISLGRTYGIYFVVTGNSRNAISSKAQDHISTNITLRMNDPLTYLDILNVRPNIIPENISGRGLIVRDKEAIEFQTALAFESENEAERVSEIISEYEELAENWNGVKPLSIANRESREEKTEKTEVAAPPKKALNLSSLRGSKKNKLSAIPNDADHLNIGGSKYSSLNYGYNLNEDFRLGIFENSTDEFKKVYENLIGNILEFEDRTVTVLDTIEKDFEELKEKYPQINYINDNEALDAYIEGLKPQLNARLDQEESVLKEKLFFIIPDITKVFRMITNEQAGFLRKFVTLINEPKYGIQFITGFNSTDDKLNDRLFYLLLVKQNQYLFGPETYDEVTEKVENLPLLMDLKNQSTNFSSNELVAEIEV